MIGKVEIYKPRSRGEFAQIDPTGEYDHSAAQHEDNHRLWGRLILVVGSACVPVAAAVCWHIHSDASDSSQAPLAPVVSVDMPIHVSTN